MAAISTPPSSSASRRRGHVPRLRPDVRRDGCAARLSRPRPAAVGEDTIALTSQPGDIYLMGNISDGPNRFGRCPWSSASSVALLVGSARAHHRTRSQVRRVDRRTCRLAHRVIRPITDAQLSSAQQRPRRPAWRSSHANDRPACRRCVRGDRRRNRCGTGHPGDDGRADSRPDRRRRPHAHGRRSVEPHMTRRHRGNVWRPRHPGRDHRHHHRLYRGDRRLHTRHRSPRQRARCPTRDRRRRVPARRRHWGWLLAGRQPRRISRRLIE